VRLHTEYIGIYEVSIDAESLVGAPMWAILTCGDTQLDCGMWPTLSAALAGVSKVKKRLEEELEAKEASLNATIVVTLCGLEEKEDAGLGYAVADYAYENRSPRDVRAFQGTVTYQDVLGNEVANTVLKVLRPIKSDQKSTSTGILPLKTHRGLRGARLEDVEIEWSVTKILFADGESETPILSNADLVRIIAAAQKE
jgi:hypothetical protein